jgi:hypothetical protein
MEAYSAPVGYVFSLNAGGRSGDFDVIAGAVPETDEFNGVYVTLANGNHAKRRFTGEADVRWFGAVGDNVFDNAFIFQAAINLCSEVLITEGVYAVDANSKSITVPSNRNIRQLNSKIIVLPVDTAESRYNVFVTAVGASFIKFESLNLEGDKYTSTSTEGGQGHGIRVLSSSDIWISNSKFTKMWGDGAGMSAFLPAEHTEPERVYIENCVFDDNRRQGLTITGKSIFVTGCTFSNTSGTAPRSGIDIEPGNGFTASDVFISDCVFKNNEGGGLEISEVSTPDSVRRVFVDRCYFLGNGYGGVRGIGAKGVVVSDCFFEGNGRESIYGGIYAISNFQGKFTNCIFKDNIGNAVYSTTLSVLDMVNCNFTGDIIYSRANISFAGCTFDNAAITLGGREDLSTLTDCLIKNSTGRALSAFSGNTKVINCVFKNNSAGEDEVIFGGTNMTFNNNIIDNADLVTKPTNGLKVTGSSGFVATNNDVREASSSTGILILTSSDYYIINNLGQDVSVTP